MAGLHDTDIRLSEDWQLTASSTGDVPLCSARDSFLAGYPAGGSHDTGRGIL